MGAGVEAVYVAGEARGPMSAEAEAQAIPGVGLAGDRYALGTGSFSRWPGPGREVTLIEAEVVADCVARFGLDLTAGRHRRNVVTRGVRLGELMHRTFRVGTALLRGDRPADPCGHLDRLIGPGVMEALRGRGGLRATVLEGGIIRPGDPIEVLSAGPGEAP
ncbi:MAG: MOSC domain-containing protein [Gemmataceae bacterium]